MNMLFITINKVDVNVFCFCVFADVIEDVLSDIFFKILRLCY